VLSVALVAVSARLEAELGDVQLLVLAGLTVGFAATVLRRSAERVRRAVAEAAAAAERERLARAVHDGVLRVLAHIRRRGTELGGEAGRLATLAGEQEVALRTLLTTGPATVDASGRRDRRRARPHRAGDAGGRDRGRRRRRRRSRPRPARRSC
jgi:hypothetical protein